MNHLIPAETAHVQHFNFECPYQPSWENHFEFPDPGCGILLPLHPISAGAYAVAELVNATDIFAYDGAYAVFELEVPELEYEYLVYDGAYATVALDVEKVLLPRDFLDGANVAANVTTTAPIRFAANAYGGENEAATLSTEPRFVPADMLDGAVVSVQTIALPFALGLVNAYDGQLARIALTDYPAETLSANAYDGAAGVVLDLVSANPNIGRAFAYDGAYASVPTLDVRAAMQMPSANAYDGHNTADITFSTQPRLFPVITEGATLQLSTFQYDYSEFVRAQGGEYLAVNIRTETKIPVQMQDGSTLHFGGLETRPGPTVGANAYGGDFLLADLTHLYSAPILPWSMVCDSWFDPHLEAATTHFNLWRCCDYPIRHDNFHIRLERYDDIRTEWSAEVRTSLDIVFSSAIRLDALCNAGEAVAVSMDVVVDLGHAVAYDGSHMGRHIAVDIDKRTDTDYTNPIVDPDNVIIDIGVGDDNPEQYEWACDGAYAEADLCCERWYEQNWYDGANIAWDLTIEKPWEVKAYDGEMIHPALSTTVQLSGNAYDGQLLTGTIYDPPILAFDGAVMEATLKFVYDVEFEEQGCLDNEHIVFDENGVKNKLKTTTATVEHEPFKHSLKARCF